MVCPRQLPSLRGYSNHRGNYRDQRWQRGHFGPSRRHGHSNCNGVGRVNPRDSRTSRLLRRDCDALRGHPPAYNRAAPNAGTAIFKFRPGPGGHSYKAVFLGTITSAGSSSSASPLSVSAPAKLPTRTAIAQSGSSGNYTLTATVGGNGSTAPTGTVSFLDTSNGNATAGTATLAAGTGFGFVNPRIRQPGPGGSLLRLETSMGTASPTWSSRILRPV